MARESTQFSFVGHVTILLAAYIRPDSRDTPIFFWLAKSAPDVTPLSQPRRMELLSGQSRAGDYELCGRLRVYFIGSSRGQLIGHVSYRNFSSPRRCWFVILDMCSVLCVVVIVQPHWGEYLFPI